jgi:hypothetical protein
MDMIYSLASFGETQLTELPKDDGVTRFFIIGDWGQLGNYLGVRRVAILLDEIASKKRFAHIITTGDNFYSKGIESIYYRFKPWAITWQYQRPYIGQIKIHPTIGNHDCYGNYQNELLYSQYNEQWAIPSDFYVLKTPLGDGKYFVNLMVNSCKLICHGGAFVSKDECDNMHIGVDAPDVREHYEWVEEQLKMYSQDATTAWLAVSLHHPPFREDALKETFLPLLRKYKVDFIFAGHEHWADFATMDSTYVTRFPQEKPDILIDCKDDPEVLIHKDREQTFKKGETLYHFITGNSGHTTESICPHYDQDGEVYWKANGYLGATAVEATSEKVTVSFHRGVDDIVYKINILA